MSCYYSSIPKLQRLHHWSLEWMSNFIPHFILLNHFNKRDPGISTNRVNFPTHVRWPLWPFSIMNIWLYTVHPNRTLCDYDLLNIVRYTFHVHKWWIQYIFSRCGCDLELVVFKLSTPFQCHWWTYDPYIDTCSSSSSSSSSLLTTWQISHSICTSTNQYTSVYFNRGTRLQRRCINCITVLTFTNWFFLKITLKYVCTFSALSCYVYMWLKYHIPLEVWDNITYSFPNFNVELGKG